MEPIEAAKAIILVGAFVFMFIYEIRFPTRAIIFVYGIVIIFDGIREGKLQKLIIGMGLAILIVCINTASRKIVAVERPRFTVWQTPFLIFLIVCCFQFYKEQGEIKGLALQVLISFIAAVISFLFIMTIFFDSFAWLFFLLGKKELVENKTVIRSTSRYGPAYRGLGVHYYYYVFIMKDKREVHFSNEYKKQFPKSRGVYDYRRTVYYQKTKFFNCIQITRIK